MSDPALDDAPPSHAEPPVAEDLEAAEPEPPRDGKPVVAMIHVGALPGTPGNRLSMSQIIRAAQEEARVYQRCGVNCLMIENMHDVPYLRRNVGPEIVAAMTMVAQAVRAESPLPIGIQILAGADREALAVAHVAELDFIRVECFSFAHIADEGLIQANAGELLRYRRMIGATEVQVWADLKKKHASHAITADLSLADAAEGAETMGAETMIVTGTTTGRPPLPADVEEARAHCRAPVFVGSGVSEENAESLLAVSDGVIVGSSFKRGGHWANAVDPDRVLRFMELAARVNSENAAATERDKASPAALKLPGGSRSPARPRR